MEKNARHYAMAAFNYALDVNEEMGGIFQNIQLTQYGKKEETESWYSLDVYFDGYGKDSKSLLNVPFDDNDEFISNEENYNKVVEFVDSLKK